jgi:predicted DNA-binding protein
MSEYKDFHIRIPVEVHTQLKLLATQRGVAQKWLMVTAIEEYLDVGKAGGKHEEIDGLRSDLFELKRRVSALREDVEILGELLSFYIFHWIGYTPRLEKAERMSLAVEAKERHERFMALFAKKLSLGELSLANILGKAVGANVDVVEAKQPMDRDEDDQDTGT